MKTLGKKYIQAAFFVALILMIGLSVYAFADDSALPIIPQQESTLLQPDQTTQNVSPSEITVQPTPSDEQVAEINEDDVPLASQQRIKGWSLINLLATMLTVVIVIALVILSTVHEKSAEQDTSSVGLVVFGIAAAILSTILFTSTQDIGTYMVVADEYTIAHIIALAVVSVCAVFSQKKEAKSSNS